MAGEPSPAEPSPEEELRELRDAVLEDWLLVTEHSVRTQREMEQSVSWRITKPLRLVRTFQLKAGELGALPAARLAAVRVAQRLGRRA